AEIPEWSIRKYRSGIAAPRSSHTACVSSSDPSSTTMTSKARAGSVCRHKLCNDARSRSARFRVGMMTLMRGRMSNLQTGELVGRDGIHDGETLLDCAMRLLLQQRLALAIGLVPVVVGDGWPNAVVDRHRIDDPHRLAVCREKVRPDILETPSHWRREVERRD